MRELEARPVDGRFLDLSAPPAHADQNEPAWSSDDITKKL